jgi:hypothetical protein
MFVIAFNNNKNYIFSQYEVAPFSPELSKAPDNGCTVLL